LAYEIANILDFELHPIYADRPQELKLATYSADEARKLLGYQTTYTLRRGLEEMIADIKAKRIKKFR